MSVVSVVISLLLFLVYFLPSVFWSYWTWPEVCQFYLPPRRTSPSCFIFSLNFKISNLFSSSLIFVICFFLVALDFVCSFLNSFRWWIELFIRDFSCFLKKFWIAMNFHLTRTVLMHHIDFVWVCFHCHLPQGIFNFCFFLSFREHFLSFLFILEWLVLYWSIVILNDVLLSTVQRSDSVIHVVAQSLSCAWLFVTLGLQDFL